jgi:hypothetical protein
MYVIPLLNLALTFCMLMAARTVPRDIAKLQAWMRDSAAKGQSPAQPVPAGAASAGAS